MNQLSAVLNSDLDNLVAGEISSDRGVLASLANDVGFVGLCGRAVSKSSQAAGCISGSQYTLAMHRQSVLITWRKSQLRCAKDM